MAGTPFFCRIFSLPQFPKTIMEWKEHYAQDHAQMDETHREFVALVDRLSRVKPEEVVEALEELLAHTGQHFAQEKAWMEMSGFPPMLCHVDEHARVLDSLEKVLAMTRQNNPGLGRIVARELEDWFIQHAATMDAALAAHLRQV
jgi:hemerythrin-like metal-binding protein